MYAELKRITCTQCKNEKTENKFSADRTKKYGRNQTCKVCISNWRKKDKEKNPNKYIDYEFQRSLRRYYGMTVEDYNRKFTSQNGKCAICERHQRDLTRSLAVDHDRDTKEIRDLLCDNCNPGIGFFKHNSDLLLKAVEYLKKFKK